MPRMFVNIEWEEIKETLRKEVSQASI